MTPELKFSENIFIETDLSSSAYDGVVLVTYPKELAVQLPENLRSFIENAYKLDESTSREPTLWNIVKVAGGRLILSPTGDITPYDDARVVYFAAKKGMKRAVAAGIKKPIVVIQKVAQYEDAEFVTIIGALTALYSGLQARELVPQKVQKVAGVGFYSQDGVNESIIHKAIALETARILTRDITISDPERMTPPKVAEYVVEAFKNYSNIKVKVISDDVTILKEYPLLAAVNRAASRIDRHKPRIVEIEYIPDKPELVTETLLLVGKGITYDTGGADIKTERNMIGMSGDKGGSGAVAGFLKACAILKPAHLKAVGIMCMARNSVGADSYVSDEILVSRSGMRVRIENTDAEGRLAMADSLYQMNLRASKEINPHIYTIATLTGHACRSYGNNYTVAMDNFVAQSEKHAEKLELNASKIGEPIEVSKLRPEDFDANRAVSENEDLMQLDRTNRVGKGHRGHQVAGAFLVMVSGLEKENKKYTHLDIAGSASIFSSTYTAAPVFALCRTHKVI